MNIELLQKQLLQQQSGIPSKKAFSLMRKERNVLGCYKVIGKYYKTRQKEEQDEDGNVSA